jgi:hypothetical protein
VDPKSAIFEGKLVGNQLVEPIQRDFRLLGGIDFVKLDHYRLLAEKYS